MQTVNQTISDVSYVLGVQRSRVNSIARALVDAGILPKSAGRAIKKVDAVQLSGLVSAFAMAEKVDDAAHVARRYMDLRLSGDKTGDTFKAVFAAQMNTSEDTVMPRITLGKTQAGFTAEIDGRFIHQGDLCQGKLPFWEIQTWGGWTKTSFTLDPAGFVILRNMFHRTYDENGAPVYEFKEA